MTAADALRFATQALTQHRRRSLLSLLGVSIGVLAVISLTALGEGARRYVMDQFSTLGSQLLIVVPGKNETTGGLPGTGGAPNDLTLEDARALGRALPEIVHMVPITASSANVSHGNLSRQTMVLGSTADFRRVRDLRMTRGHFLPPADLERSAPIVVLGRKIAHALFPGNDPLGKTVRVGDWRMRVIGVLAVRGTQMGVDMDESVVVPVATGLRMANRRSLRRIILELRFQSEANVIKRKVIAIMRERHGEEDITCLTQEAVMSSLSAILGTLTLVVAGIASISLGVAGVGVMNVMLVSVSERTAEVGLMKALGASRRQILTVFLLEAVLLSSAGGAIGLALGWLSIRAVVAIYPAIPAAAPTWVVLAVLGLSFGTGSVFGVLPAWRASRLDPVRALAGH